MNVNNNISNTSTNTPQNPQINPLTDNSSLNSQNFNKNYQIIISNYTKVVKYYSNHKQITDEIEKIVTEYRDIIYDFLIKLKQLHENIKAFEDKTFSKTDVNCFSKIKLYLSYIKHILAYQGDAFYDLLNQFENNCIFTLNTKKDDTFINTLHQNKSILQNEGKKMEKEFIDCENKYIKLMNNFEDAENIMKSFFYKKRKNCIEKKKSDSSDNLENALKETLNIEEEFGKVYNIFKIDNNKYFEKYNKFINDLEAKINKDYKYLNNNIGLFISKIFNNYKNISTVLERVLNIYNEREAPKEKDEKENENKIIEEKEKEINKKEEKGNITDDINNFDLFKTKYLEQYEIKYTKEKYKIKSIHDPTITRSTINNINNTNNNNKPRKGSKNSNQKNSIKNNSQQNENETECEKILGEDLFEIVKSFYAFQFIDRSEYDLEVEKKKINFRFLINKLLVFGFSKKKNNEYAELKPITEEEIPKLLNNLDKKEYRLIFLQKLNNFRSLGIFEFPQREFEITSNFFKSMMDLISQEEDKDFDSMRLILILSQTFYINENGKKYYLDRVIKGHKIFSDKEFWEKYILININNEIKKIIKNNKSVNDKAYQDTAFSNIVPFCASMIDFGMSKEILMKIIEHIFQGFYFDEKSKETIQQIIESKNNFIKD